MATDSCVQWRRLNSLGGQALFVGPSSKFLQASECGAQPDCIYFICDYDWDILEQILSATATTAMRPKDVSEGRSEEKFYSARPGWFFPS
ncbi:hypothetical protein SETIT_4G061400v2 [Setaria italica]|uniref:KIB1-4 beta-propeller domain-containing protein n=1 Tax=Setaria italica TaxID=4555 RepID=K3Y3E4_SETIT|nr:hypothetical protein SETIT_4G061400v2 [Setaria italica]